MTTTDHYTAALLRSLITAADTDTITDWLDGEDDTPAPGPERDALTAAILDRLQRIADLDTTVLEGLLAARTGQEG